MLPELWPVGWHSQSPVERWKLQAARGQLSLRQFLHGFGQTETVLPIMSAPQIQITALSEPHLIGTHNGQAHQTS